MRDETMRAQLDQIEQGLSQVERAREQFHELLTPLVELFADYETSRSRLHELKTKHAVLEDTHGALNARYGSALAERDTIAEVAAAEKRESRELRQRLQRAEAGLAAAQAESREGVAAREKLERTLEAESRRMAAQSDEIGRLRAELAERDQKSGAAGERVEGGQRPGRTDRSGQRQPARDDEIPGRAARGRLAPPRRKRGDERA